MIGELATSIIAESINAPDQPHPATVREPTRNPLR